MGLLRTGSAGRSRPAWRAHFPHRSVSTSSRLLDPRPLELHHFVTDRPRHRLGTRLSIQPPVRRVQDGQHARGLRALADLGAARDTAFSRPCRTITPANTNSRSKASMILQPSKPDAHDRRPRPGGSPPAPLGRPARSAAARSPDPSASPMVGLLALPQRHPTGDALRARPADFDVLEIETATIRPGAVVGSPGVVWLGTHPG